MPESMDIRRAVRKSGYTILTWALKALIAQEQYKLAAMIIAAVCLAPRKTELENNGVLAVLRNAKLFQLAKTNAEFGSALTAEIIDHKHFSKIGMTFVAAGWWEDHSFYPDRKHPYMFTDDDIMYYASAMNQETNEQTIYALCDHAGSQAGRYYRHFRLILDYNGYSGVRVVGRQMDRDHRTLDKSTRIDNGYYEFRIPSTTILHRMQRSLCGRTLEDVMEPGVWYNYHFVPDSAPDTATAKVASR
jgi:hypothetical protein